MENQYLVMQKSNIKVSKEHSKRCKKYFDEIISGKEIYVRLEKKLSVRVIWKVHMRIVTLELR